MGGFLLLIYSQVSICQVLSTFHRAAIYGEGDGYMGTAYLEGAVNITWITNYGKKCRRGALTAGKDLGTFLALCTLPVMGRFVSILHSTTSGIQKDCPSCPGVPVFRISNPPPRPVNGRLCSFCWQSKVFSSQVHSQIS